MEQFNSNTYKKSTAWQDFHRSCLGRLIILAVICVVLIIIAALTRPTESMMLWQTEDNIHECLQSNDSIQKDIIDDYVANVGRIITHADTAETNQEMWKTFLKLNRIEINSHALFRTARVINNIHPEGVRVGIGVFGIVIPTIKYSDLLMNTGAVRGKYGERLIRNATIPEDLGENPDIQPFHYRGNPDD